METTRESVKEKTIHRKLSLRVKGLGIVKEGDWRGLLIVAAHYGDKDWEIVEKVSGLGERIITKHSSLLHGHEITKGV
jgi:hypothetical protein